LKQKLEPKDVLNIVFKLTDYLNFLWNFYVVFNVAVIGWLFSSSSTPWAWQKKLIVAIIYVFFVCGSITVIRRTYQLLFSALEELSSASTEIDFRSSKFGEYFQGVKPFNSKLSIAFHVIADCIVFLTILAKGVYF
jgi:hypothetical protein